MTSHAPENHFSGIKGGEQDPISKLSGKFGDASRDVQVTTNVEDIIDSV